MISIAGFFTLSGSLTGKVFNFCTNKDYIMMTKEQEAKLKALQVEIATCNVMIEDRDRLLKKGEETLERLKEMKSQKEAGLEANLRKIAFLKEYIRNEKELLKNRF